MAKPIVARWEWRTFGAEFEEPEKRIIEYMIPKGDDEPLASMSVRGFVEPIAKELPMEYALELNRLIELQMEGAVG